eukprot:767198-Hanusia_phi.AAC.4
MKLAIFPTFAFLLYIQTCLDRPFGTISFQLDRNFDGYEGGPGSFLRICYPKMQRIRGGGKPAGAYRSQMEMKMIQGDEEMKARRTKEKAQLRKQRKTKKEMVEDTEAELHQVISDQILRIGTVVGDEKLPQEEEAEFEKYVPGGIYEVDSIEEDPAKRPVSIRIPVYDAGLPEQDEMIYDEHADFFNSLDASEKRGPGVRPLQWGEDASQIPGLLGRVEDLTSLDQWNGPGADKYARDMEIAARKRGSIDVDKRGEEVFQELLDDIGEEVLPQRETARKMCVEVARRENCRSEEKALRRKIEEMREEEQESNDDPLQDCLDDLDLPASENSAAGWEERDQYGRMLPKRYKRVSPILLCEENLRKGEAMDEANMPELGDLRTYAQVTKDMRVLHTMGRQLIEMVDMFCSVFLKYNDTKLVERHRRDIPEMMRLTGMDKRVPEDDEADEESREYRRSISMAHAKKLKRQAQAREEEEFMYNISQSFTDKDLNLKVKGLNLPDHLANGQNSAFDFMYPKKQVESPFRRAQKDFYADGESDMEAWIDDKTGGELPSYITKQPDYGYIVDFSYVPTSLPPILEQASQLLRQCFYPPPPSPISLPNSLSSALSFLLKCLSLSPFTTLSLSFSSSHLPVPVSPSPWVPNVWHLCCECVFCQMLLLSQFPAILLLTWHNVSG